MLAAWTLFLLLAAVVAVAGYWLSRFGHAIAEHTGLSGTWIGLALMATVTSLPELVTGLSAVRIPGGLDLAVGDALGSCVFNLLLLSAIDFFYRPSSMFGRASQGHALSAGYGAVLIAVVGLNLLSPLSIPGFGVSAATAVILPIYLMALRSTFTYERRRLLEPPEPTAARFPDLTLRRAIVGYVAAAGCVVAAGILLPGAALAVAGLMGWNTAFVGTLFLAGATSLPELVVTLSAVRIGALDMAVANLLGSNLFNMVVLAVDDLAFPAAPLLSSVSAGHLATVLTVLFMNGVVTAELIYRPTRRGAGVVSWASVALVAAYLVNALLQYRGFAPVPN